MSHSIRQAKAPFGEAIFVCAKCARKLGRGSKTKSKLRGALKRSLKRRRGRLGKVRVLDVGCLDLCPKGRQTLATGRDLGRRRLWVVDKDVSPEAMLDRMFADDAGAGGLPMRGGEAQTDDKRPAATDTLKEPAR